MSIVKRVLKGLGWVSIIPFTPLLFFWQWAFKDEILRLRDAPRKPQLRDAPRIVPASRAHWDRDLGIPANKEKDTTLS